MYYILANLSVLSCSVLNPYSLQSGMELFILINTLQSYCRYQVDVEYDYNVTDNRV